MTTPDLKTWLTDAPSQLVKIGVTDIDGILRTKYLHRKKILQALDDGLGFCSVVFQWDAHDRVYSEPADPSFADATATLIPDSHRNLPWEDGIPFLLADFSGSPGSSPAAACPRSLLKRIVERAETMGFHARFGPEYEWFAYRETPDTLHEKQFKNLRPLTPGMFGYSSLRTGMHTDFHQELFRHLTEANIELEGLHTETGPGALEAAIAHQPALEAADRAVLFKEGVKQISYRHGLIASFMAKPRADLPGCGGHLHQSLWQGDRNVFHDADRPHGMSKTLGHYLAGQLALLPSLLPLYAPSVNSYKRYVPGSWAATRANWGIDNRTTALRVISGSEQSTRLETRVPGADANPYLAIAAALASGLYGIEHELPLPDPVRGSAYSQQVGEALAKDLGGAAGAMNTGKAIPTLLGQAFASHFVHSRHLEWQQYQRAVTDWECRRYFELA